MTTCLCYSSRPMSPKASFLALLLVGIAPACSSEDHERHHGGAADEEDNAARNKKGGPSKNADGDSDGPSKTPEPAGSSSYTELDTVPNAGTIKGTITYGGARRSEPLAVTKDEGTCNHGGQPDGSIELADGKLANVLVYIEEIERGKKWASADPVTINNHECIFTPHVLVGRHRGEVAITNSDPVLHNTNLIVREGHRTLGNISLPRQGQTIQKSLRKEGLVEVKCDVHPWMKAFLFVTPHPYAVVTAADGTFTLDGVPPGTYKIKIWHEVLGEKEMNVTVEANGTATLDVAFE